MSESGATPAPQTTDLRQQAMRAVIDAPYYGFHPSSNRWGDVDYTKPSGEKSGFDGDAVAYAFRQGWLFMERLDEPGLVLEADPLDGGTVEFLYRFQAVPAWRSILTARLMRGN